MKKNTLALAAAALSGLLAGSAARTATASTSALGNAHQMTGVAGQRAIGLDAPTPHDCKGKNACKGQGGCKTSDKGCKGLNSCKGNGGCKVVATTQKSGL